MGFSWHVLGFGLDVLCGFTWFVLRICCGALRLFWVLSRFFESYLGFLIVDLGFRFVLWVYLVVGLIWVVCCLFDLVAFCWRGFVCFVCGFGGLHGLFLGLCFWVIAWLG